MNLSDPLLARMMIIFLGLLGFLVARHIYAHKKNQKPLACPIRFDCNTVINSDYSKFFGIPVELLGMGYYIIIFISYLFFVFLPELLPDILVGFIKIMSVTAFIFSIYLIIVQIFILKKGCSWCIISAFISASIFFLTLT